FCVGEVVPTSEGFINTLGRSRVYVEQESDPKHLTEVPYYQPALYYDLETGEAAEGAGDVGEHLMIGRFDSQKVSKKDLVACIKIMYQWTTAIPEDAFATKGAYFIQRKHVNDLIDEYEGFLKENGALVTLSKGE